MKPKLSSSTAKQRNLFAPCFAKILNKEHELYQLAQKINWKFIEDSLADCYCEDNGRPGTPIRFMAGLLYLKYTYNVSDEALAMRWVENPYWQYFCGYENFQHQFPIDYTTLIKWRQRVGVEKLQVLLQETIELAQREGVLKKKDLKCVTVDTTVQEKNITFPTDSKLMCRLIQKLGSAAVFCGIKLRQSYSRTSMKLANKVGRYSHAKQFKRMNATLKKLRTRLKRLVRDIQRKKKVTSSELEKYLELAQCLMNQTKTSKRKIYSLHEPEVQCISKGKSHKRYEFGQKVSIVTSNRSNWVLGVKIFFGRPYDGHTLEAAIMNSTELSGVEPKEIHVDKGYRGNGYSGSGQVHISGCGRKKLPEALKKRKRRRSAIEPIIGHIKEDHRMNRCWLKGTSGDEINALMAGVGFNMRKMLKLLREFLSFLIESIFPHRQHQFFMQVA